MGMIGRAGRALRLARLSELAVRPGRCPSCGPTLFAMLARESIAVRCMRCGASVLHLAVMSVVERLHARLTGLRVYEASAHGPLVRFLRRRDTRLTCSEFFDDVEPGDWRGNVQCQDLQRLTYADASFDLCTSTEVFEHVADDRRAFGEILRVLRAGGHLVFTVPLGGNAVTIERAVVENGSVRHLLPPEFHGDRLRGMDRVLCFRNYGSDIVSRLRDCGFETARIERAEVVPWSGFAQQVIVATKGCT
jgi:SAM-dependent methyltransferase